MNGHGMYCVVNCGAAFQVVDHLVMFAWEEPPTRILTRSQYISLTFPTSLRYTFIWALIVATIHLNIHYFHGAIHSLADTNVL